MDYEYIKFTTLKVFKDCNVKSFPIDCFSILDHYDLKAYSYKSLPVELQEYCMKYSEDALNFKDKICYNDNFPSGRIRFSLMHELGHIILNHGENRTPEMEQEANFFASNILAPRMAMHYAKCKNHNEVAKLFNITNEAAEYAFNDYKRWYRWTIYHKMNTFDKALYSHFYNKEQGKFIYRIEHCIYCHSEIFNSKDYVCKKCHAPAFNYSNNMNMDFLVAQSQWLYGGL